MPANEIHASKPQFVSLNSLIAASEGRLAGLVALVVYSAILAAWLVDWLPGKARRCLPGGSNFVWIPECLFCHSF